ncbi:ATP-binding protein [Pseudomonas sp. App30]|uniref:ATP-binding protein n=1 Tax=Pseudomonas sp. App30 TaxID=3068990 RepID=UPI003A80D5A2
MAGCKKRLNESIQLRLSVTLSAAILVVAIVAGVFAFVSAFDEALEMQDNTLRQMATLFDRQHMTLAYPAEGQAIKGDDEESRIIVQYLADGSQALGQDDAALPLPLPTDLADGLSTQQVGGEPFRVLVHTTASGQRIAVAQETGTRDREARESAWRGLLPFLILFPVLLMVVADLVRKVFRPIAQLASEVEQRDDQQLHPMDEQHLPSEIRAFVLAINGLLGRVAGAMDEQRRFVADAAHELRSPLAALSLQAERLAVAPMPALAQQRLATLQLGIERGKQLVEQLLALAAAQEGGASAETAVVHEVFRQVLEALWPLAEAKGIDLGVEPGPALTLPLSPLALHTLVRNLLDNAIRYTPPGGRVDLAVALAEGEALIQVRDSGPGIAEAERERVFDPFYRSLGTRESGSGLGLSIVQAIAVRHGARVSLATNPSGTGLCASVRFPTPP